MGPLEKGVGENEFAVGRVFKDDAGKDLKGKELGIKCSLAHCGHSKDDKPRHKQVLLAIMVNDRGYPFKWDVYPGNTAEVKTLIGNVEACRKRFGLKNVTLVFDRGIVSAENLDDINDQGLKYVSALDKDQFPGIGAIDWNVFTGLTGDNFQERLSGWERYDDSLYFRDLGLYDGRRYILGFTPQLCREERTVRREKISNSPSSMNSSA